MLTQGNAKAVGALLPVGTKFKHIVFADTLNFARKPVDYAVSDVGNAMNLPAPATCVPDERPASADDLHFARWVLQRAGISADAYRAETLSRRLPATLRAIRASSATQARSQIERNDTVLQTAISALIIGVSGFFRDQSVFEAIREQVLPRIAEGAGAKIWSVGCSDGSEVYSIAMQLAEMRLLHRCSILGTDCRVHATRNASVGRYSAGTTEREVPPQMLESYFIRDAKSGEYRVGPLLRTAVRFRCADVLSVHEPGPWDAIFCRNMAIYMRRESSAKLWKLLESALRPGGFLVLGRAERPDGTTLLSPVGPCIYRRDRG